MSDIPPLQSGRPRHEQLSEWLRAQITSGAYSVDEQLPSESELGALFEVSRITVRRAVATLENEGLIYRRQGLGSFVSAPKVPQGLVRLTDFTQDMERAGLEPSSRVLHRAQEKAPPAAAAALGIDEGSVVVRLDRLRLGNDRPVALDRTWLPPFYAQLLEGYDLSRDTIYRVLESDYEIPVLRGRYRIEAVLADADTAEALGVAAGEPLLLIERTSLSTGDRAIYFQRRYYRADRVSFELELERGAGAADHTDGMPLRDFEPVFNIS